MKMNDSTSIRRKSIHKKDLDTLDQFDRNGMRNSRTYDVEINTENNKISIAGFGSRSIDSIVKHLPDEILKGFKDTVLSIAKSRVVAESTLLTAYIKNLNYFFRTEKTPNINTEALSNFHEHCRRNKTPPYIFASVKKFLLKWHEYGYHGVSDEEANYLMRINPPVKNTPSGSKIRSDNPEEGWYLDKEYDDLVQTIWKDFESDTVDIQKSLILLLGAQYGRRPVQIAHLKIGDIKSNGENCGVSGKRIEFPGVKDKGAGGGFRKSKQEVHPMGDELWELCQLQINKSHAAWEAAFEYKILSNNKSELPLFYPGRNSYKKRDIELAIDNSTHADNVYASHCLHISPANVSKIMRRIKGIDKESGKQSKFGTPVISSRTGKPLVESAYRFRYTRSRQLARIGVPRLTLQYWMGHESARSIDAYYDDPAERARVLEEAINPLLAPLAQAFQGTLIDSESDAIRANEPSSRLELDGKEDLSVGSCGEYGFCSASVPIPCYRCSKFQPWVYGPHEEVLQRLLQRQQMENEVPLVGQGRRLLVPIQLEREIRAVRIVVEICEKRKTELEQIND
jgi:integrase